MAIWGSNTKIFFVFLSHFWDNSIYPLRWAHGRSLSYFINKNMKGPSHNASKQSTQLSQVYLPKKTYYYYCSCCCVVPTDFSVKQQQWKKLEGVKLSSPFRQSGQAKCRHKVPNVSTGIDDAARSRRRRHSGRLACHGSFGCFEFDLPQICRNNIEKEKSLAVCKTIKIVCIVHSMYLTKK